MMSLENIENNALLTIETNYYNLRKSERKVADYIMANAPDVVHLTIADLSSQVGVSEPTVIRFCKNIGMTGYQDFKIQLAHGITKPLPIIHDTISQEDTIQEVGKKVINSHMIALDQTLNQLNFDLLNKVSERLLASRYVDFYGLGGSGTVAIDVENKFLRTNLQTHVYTDSHLQLMRTSLMGSDDTVVIFSNTGNTQHFRNLIELANNSNVCSILITSMPQSSLAKLATYSIDVKSKEIRYKNEPSSSRIAMLAVMDIIVTYIALLTHDDYIANIYTTRNALKSEKFRKNK